MVAVGQVRRNDEAAATAVVLLVFVVCLNLLAGGVGKLMKKGMGET